jgi:protein-disulfide isomerase
MKVPEKIIPFLFVLLLVAAFLLGRYQGQIELLRGGAVPQSGSGQSVAQGTQTGSQTNPAPGTTGGKVTVIPDDLWNEVLTDPAAARGSENAPVTMVEFTDYQCPFCERHFTDTQPQIDQDYIDTGKVRYLIRDMPLPIHPNAPAAAYAARCAADQGKYWEMHDLLFQKQTEWSSGNTDELFSGYAGDVGLDVNSFTSCLSDGKYKKAVDADMALAQKVGVGGTPAFLINKELIIGAQPFTVFQQAIEKAQSSGS